MGRSASLTIDVTVPFFNGTGRLPPLRFGHTYQLRARIVDVCNNALPVDTTASNSQQATAPMLYGRHEPIGSPDVYLQSILRLGESLKRLVIRDIDKASYTSVRALAPQRCQEPFAEWHGMFDTGGAIDGSTTTYDEIVNRESEQYLDPPATVDLTSSVPYLPDPLARGGVLSVPTTIPPEPLSGQAFTFDFSPETGQLAHLPAVRPHARAKQVAADERDTVADDDRPDDHVRVDQG